MLRRSFASISDDQRIQAVIIAFSFGALLEALAGFGTPVAITAVMLIAVGFKPIKAASVALVANTAPVAFGAIAIPIVTLAGITDLPKEDLGAMVGRQTPLLALFVPLILVGMVDGMRGVRAVWPAAMVGGITFAVGQFLCSNYISVELTDIVASLLSVGALVALPARVAAGGPAGGRGRGRTARDRRRGRARHRPRGGRPPAGGRRPDSGRDIAGAYAPYLIIIVVFSLAQWGPIKDFLAKGVTQVHLARAVTSRTRAATRRAPSTYKFNWLPAAGTLLLICGLLTMVVLRISPGRALRAYGAHAQPAQVGDADRRGRARRWPT